MIPKVTIRGAKHLPKTVTKENLRLAAIKLGSYYGIKSMVVQVTNDNHEDDMASAVFEKRKVPIVLLHSPCLHGWASQKRGRTIRKSYAYALAHELAHIRQWTRGAYAEIPDDLADDEATAMEKIYGPIALECLRA